MSSVRWADIFVPLLYERCLSLAAPWILQSPVLKYYRMQTWCAAQWGTIALGYGVGDAKRFHYLAISSTH
jgi:hypothetical protein